MGSSNQALANACPPTDGPHTCVLTPRNGIFTGPCIPADGTTLAVMARISAALDTGTRSQDRTVDVTNAAGVLALANDVVVSDDVTGDGDVRLALAWDVSDGTLRAAVTVTPLDPPPAPMEPLSAVAELGWTEP